jgi:hypothetical protein
MLKGAVQACVPIEFQVAHTSPLCQFSGNGTSDSLVDAVELLKQTEATQLGRQRASDVAELMCAISDAAVKEKSGESGQQSNQRADRAVVTVRVGFEVAERTRVS